MPCKLTLKPSLHEKLADFENRGREADPTVPSTRNKIDSSAIAKLVEDFGFLLISDDFERYLEDQRTLVRKRHAGTAQQANDERFLPMLSFLGLEANDADATFRHGEVIERLQVIEQFVMTLLRTADFVLEVRELHKRLKRRFEGKKAIQLPFNTPQLISPVLAQHCRDVMWIINEFHVEEKNDPFDVSVALWNVNIWTIILDADRLHRETGMVHHAFYKTLKSYQAGRGAGSPRYYARAALTILLAECFEDFDTEGRRPRIHDFSLPETGDDKGKKVHRRPNFNSPFARFLIEFCRITALVAIPDHNDGSLEKYRKIARKRVQMNLARISDRLKSSMKAPEVIEIFRILDQAKS